MPWLRWTTRSPSLRSRKLSIAQALVAPAGRGPADVGPREQLMIADHERGASAMWNPARMRPTVSAEPSFFAELRITEDLAEPFDLARVVAGDQHAIAGRRVVEFGLHLRQFAAEPLDRLNAQMAGRFERTRGDRRHADRGKFQELRERRVDREQPRGSATRARYCRPSSRRSFGSTSTIQASRGKASTRWPSCRPSFAGKPVSATDSRAPASVGFPG